MVSMPYPKFMSRSQQSDFEVAGKDRWTLRVWVSHMWLRQQRQFIRLMIWCIVTDE